MSTTRNSTPSGQGWRILLCVAAAGVVLVMSALLPRYIGELGVAVLPLIAVAFVAAIVLFLVPVHALPAIAIAIFALVPSRILNQDGPLGALPLTSLIIVLWAVRRVVVLNRTSNESTGVRPQRAIDPFPPRMPTDPWRLATRLFGVFFFGWALFVLIRSSELQTSTGWLISFSAGALLPLVFVRAQAEADLVRRVWMILGAVLGTYAVLEAVLRSNPIWGTLYTLVGAEPTQHWSVYRAEASFGHPLFASLFFAVSCALATGLWLSSPSRWVLVCALLSGLGLVATVSRGALLAIAIAFTFSYLAALALRGEKRWSRFGLMAAFALVGVIGLTQFDALAARNDSLEASLSAQSRSAGITVALAAARANDWLGSGPGTSGIAGRLIADTAIENSALQLLISVGIPGLALFAALLGSAFIAALHSRGIGESAALLAYAICITGFNAIDALRAMHLLLGMLLLLALNPSRLPFARPPTQPRSFTFVPDKASISSSPGWVRLASGEGGRR